jgi:hypothetical protein
MAKNIIYATMCAWLVLIGARAGAEEAASAPQPTAQEAAPATVQQPTSETPTQPVEQQPIVQATSFPTSPGVLQAAPDQAGTILPGFGFPYGSVANLTGTGITPFSQGGLVTGTGLLPYQQAASASPYLFTVSQNVRFNDNVQFTPQNTPTILGLKKGDWIETTQATVSPSMYISEQVLFAHATYGFNRYRQDTQLDSNFWNADAGLNWKFGHLCKGTGLAAISQNQVPFQELTAFAIQTVTAQSVTETANCKLTDRFNGIIEGAYRTNEISGGNNQSVVSNVVANAGPGNNYREQQIRAGLEYALPGLDTVRPQATFTDREFGNRPAGITTVTGLASATNLSLYELVYHRDVSTKLKFDGNIGFNQITIISPGSSSTNVTAWSYSAALLYKATPKLTFQATSAQGIAPPLAVLSNFQATRLNTLSLEYRYSAKLVFNAALSQATTINATSSLSSFSGTGISGTGFNPVAGEIQTRTVQIGARYRASPFLSAFATYSYLDSKNVQLGQTTLQNLYLVGLTWRH